MRNCLLPTVFCAVLLAGPAPLLADDEIGKDQALLRMFAGTSGMNASSFYDGFATETCEAGPGRLATFSLVSKKEQTERVPAAGARLFVLGVAHVEPRPGEQMLKNVCRAMRSFVPQAGHTYEVRQDFSERNCPITVKDAATRAEVATTKHKPAGKCKDRK